MPTLRFKDLVGEDEVCHFAAVTISSSRPTISHSHDFHEIFWVIDGEGWHWINGQKRELKRGTLVLIRASDAHAFSVFSDHFFVS